ncbi:uncharacterized protein BDZ99DRAFT_521313 [Mytilinidion resinicola]|uniref:Uncharacterized protein n=1 Tax=Mytilinidion resinicola TaxID=574789 RepID=A0A6A6YLU4_9PEZI|nr:uncharacterized protein BDZ99DRAFT_521313 [Mytilinidion resinicola]KAF2808837.1 hypothetical protein BDZ99DRAFT_521313 [Mytilinidion resinicola]
MVLLDSTETHPDENRLRHQPAMKLHKLVCGHWVFTKQPEQCAPNCKVINGPTSWPELLLEKYNLNPFAEASGLGGRVCMVVYLAVDGTIIPCLDNVDAAVIRILMSKHDDRGDLVVLPARPDLLYLFSSQRNTPPPPPTPTEPKAMRGLHTSPGTGKGRKNLTSPKRGRGVTKQSPPSKSSKDKSASWDKSGQKSKQRATGGGGDGMDVGEGLSYGDEGVEYQEGSEEGEVRVKGTLEEEEAAKKLREAEKTFERMALD